MTSMRCPDENCHGKIREDKDRLKGFPEQDRKYAKVYRCKKCGTRYIKVNRHWRKA